MTTSRILESKIPPIFDISSLSDIDGIFDSHSVRLITSFDRMAGNIGPSIMCFEFSPTIFIETT